MTSTTPATPSAAAHAPDPSTRSNAAECRALTLGYGSKVVLADVDLDIPVGAVTALIGPNGAGKSTLLHALAGLIRPHRGEVNVPARQRAGGVALVLQATDTNAHLPLTVYEAIAMGRYPYRRYWRRLTRDDRAAINAAMDILQISDLAGAQLWEISGGQRQRALIAQGLAQQAEVLLLDEPYTGLDILSRASIRDAVDHERAAGRTVVVSTHDIGDAAAADRVVLLAGRLVAAGTPQSALTDANLSAAYGGRLIHLGEGRILLDDPHHHQHSQEYDL
jgi:ABC-type Mn2+/Zn2+ transport system ATPase subunit